ncbi:MAG: sensor histidine kinase [Geminicoccaceae bacterium]
MGIEAEVRNGSMLVRVSDNGKGVASEDQERIFDKFQQAQGDEEGPRQSTGLGLPISRQIIEHFGGRIWVESQASEGSRVIFSLPVSRQICCIAIRKHSRMNDVFFIQGVRPCAHLTNSVQFFGTQFQQVTNASAPSRLIYAAVHNFFLRPSGRCA